MPKTIVKLIDGNWNEVKDEKKAAWRLHITFSDDGLELMRRRETVGVRAERETYSTDPRAKAVMKEGVHGGTPMSNPTKH